MRNKGMKLLSKIVAACIALVLTISMGVPVQASIEKNTQLLKDRMYARRMQERM